MTETAPEPPKLARSEDNRLLAGICSGLAKHLGLEPAVVRLAFIALGIGGISVAIYMSLMFFVPRERPAETSGPETGTEHGGARSDSRPGRDMGQLLMYSALSVGLLALFLAFGGVLDPVLWFIVFGTLGGAILWQQTDPARRGQWVSSTKFRIRQTWVRSLAGIVLVVIGVIGFLVFRQELTEARQGLSATLAMLAGTALIAAPWILRLVRERDRERRERIRSQERAELAAHIHDSVLHTLTLIQRRSEEPWEVQRLARVQERALRSWLYQRPADAATTISPALEHTAADVEEAHGVPIEVVCVGDCPLDGGLRAALQAAREAMVNASKYAGVNHVAVFAEVEPGEVLIFVRDRGEGFDLGSIPDDRMGVRGSILDRMDRHGGSARIRTEPGEGTEVQLRMPRAAEEEAFG